jgi:hypothetical protein
MIQRRAGAASIKTRIGNHTFRATGITAYLKKVFHDRCRSQRRMKIANVATSRTFNNLRLFSKEKGTLEAAQHIANHESPRTTKLYDRRQG